MNETTKKGPGRVKKVFRFLRRLPGTIISILLGGLMLVAAAPLSLLLILGAV